MRLDEKSKLLGNFWKPWNKMQYKYRIFIHFGKVTKTRAFRNNIIFQQQYFPFGGMFPIFPPCGAYSLILASLFSFIIISRNSIYFSVMLAQPSPKNSSWSRKSRGEVDYYILFAILSQAMSLILGLALLFKSKRISLSRLLMWSSE